MRHFARVVSRTVLLVLLSWCSLAQAGKKEVESFFEACAKAARGSDVKVLQTQLNAARGEERSDYRYLYYQAVLLYAQGEVVAGQKMRQAVEASLRADGYSVSAIRNVDRRLDNLYQSALQRVRGKLLVLPDSRFNADAETGEIVEIMRVKSQMSCHQEACTCFACPSLVTEDAPTEIPDADSGVP